MRITRADREKAFLPSMWWVWLLLGFGGLIITVTIGVVFGLSVVEVLLGRDIALVLFLAIDYVLIGFGFWLAIKAIP